METLRSRGITRDDVWTAADSLLKAGQRPTIERIRLHLGRGSPNTVSPHLDAWFAALGGRLHDPEGFAPKPGCPEPVTEAARYLWEAALQVARAQAEAALGQRETALAEAQATLAREREALEQERLVMQARLEGAEAAMAEMTRARDEALERGAQVESRATVLQQQVETLRAEAGDALEARVALQREFAAERATWDQERETMTARATANERRLALDLDAARVAGKEAQKLLEAERKAALERLAHAAEAASRQGSEMTRLSQSIAVLEERIRQREAMLVEYREQKDAGSRSVAAVGRRGRPARGALAGGASGLLRTRAAPGG
ncbi:DNA-binding protein [Cupriavidus consociatus]|uniref:DNA-binding protein n=1 Tax=Cupriavidus consociatus TaxID=2821357 RepID=UPI001AE158D0|nr:MULTISPECIES: DNA-binding protein [unclassified Cupriavidus]MBP0623282.1 DNA-binding protein [Cupriavidus sp. LEh25]MDK2659976.1 DNA-binding protein [Cupriavidus sp. LEh21]